MLDIPVKEYTIPGMQDDSNTPAGSGQRIHLEQYHPLVGWMEELKMTYMIHQFNVQFERSLSG